ncbi:hypothetical protein SDC9_123184 [bioreactor metagenome]|uniref:Uncharacterized protein n=1 Tax=bioreactor metagenome TaxID=1076179 RepID=A0A645CGU8_9ZZZZ
MKKINILRSGTIRPEIGDRAGSAADSHIDETISVSAHLVDNILSSDINRTGRIEYMNCIGDECTTTGIGNGAGVCSSLQSAQILRHGIVAPMIGESGSGNSEIDGSLCVSALLVGYSSIRYCKRSCKIDYVVGSLQPASTGI